MESSTSNKPVKAFRLRGLSASVFKNTAKTNGRTSAFFKVSLQKTYKDGDEFKTTTSLGRDDLPLARLLIERAWEFILESESKGRTGASDED